MNAKTPSISKLYEQARELGEPVSLQFWIEGPHGRVCGEVLNFENGTFICPQPWGTEHEHGLATIQPGKTYTFACTSMENSIATPRHGWRATVLEREHLHDPEAEPMWLVRFADGERLTVFEGELNGWYLLTRQHVGVWREDPMLADRILEPLPEPLRLEETE